MNCCNALGHLLPLQTSTKLGTAGIAPEAFDHSCWLTARGVRARCTAPRPGRPGPKQFLLTGRKISTRATMGVLVAVGWR
jgi:hypothetical protein